MLIYQRVYGIIWIFDRVGQVVRVGNVSESLRDVLENFMGICHGNIWSLMGISENNEWEYDGIWDLSYLFTLGGWWFGTLIIFSISWEFHNPN